MNAGSSAGQATPKATPAPGAAGASKVRVGVATTAAIGAVFVGLGLARFAFAPLEPALVADGWFSGSSAALLAAANLIGYLIGALSSSRLARRFQTTSVIRVSMLIVGASFFACAIHALPFAWFFLWRVASGVTGGIIMGLAGPTVLAYVSAPRRALIGELVLYGQTVGIIIAGALIPVLVDNSVELAWIVLGCISLLTSVVTWRMWPPSPAPSRSGAPEKRTSEHAGRFCLQYSLMAIGLVPQMIFLVDFIARDLGRGVAVGSHFYLLYGFGSIIGPFLYNFSVQRIGLRTTLRAGIVVQLISTVLLIISTTDPVLGVASFLAGIGMPAIIAAFLLRSEQISENDPLRHRTLWGRATASFAVGQAIAGCGTAFLIEAFGSNGLAYPLLFYMAAGSLVLAFLIDFTIRR